MIAAVLIVVSFVTGADDVASLFRQAREAEKRRDFASALQYYDRVLAVDAGIAEVWANKGLVLSQLERHKEALAAFAKAVALKPQLGAAQLFLGLEYFRFGDRTKALEPLNAALRLDPENPAADEARNALALVYLDQGTVAARKLVRSGLPFGKLLLAEYQVLSGVPDAAEGNFAEALKALPHSREIRDAFHQFYFARGETEKARDLGPEPDNAQDELGPALELFRRGAYDKALPLFLRAETASPSGRALYYVSQTYRGLARSMLLESIRRNPDSFRSHLLLADLARTASDDATAQAEYEKAAALAPRNEEVQVFYIRFLASRDRAAALAAARRAIGSLPSSPVLNVELGKLLLKQGEAKEAAAHFDRALTAEPGLAAARAGLAEACAANGDVPRAIAEMEGAVGADPDGAWHYRLATWYRASGRTAEAKEAFAATARIKAEARARAQASLEATFPPTPQNRD